MPMLHRSFIAFEAEVRVLQSKCSAHSGIRNQCYENKSLLRKYLTVYGNSGDSYKAIDDP